MDVTPQLLQDIEFREKVRGYHPDDVDDFLERVGVAFSELVDRLRQANDRADAAETALAERGEVDESALTRTLVLAQRTADAAITEAKAEAELTLAEAKSEADRLAAEAEAEAERMVSKARSERDELVRAAEADARAQAAAATGPIEDQIAELEARRDAIAAQSGGLESWLAAQRVKLESVATDLQEILDDPERLRADPAPAIEQPSVAETAGSSAGLTLVESETDVGAAESSVVDAVDAVDAEADPTEPSHEEPASSDEAPVGSGGDHAENVPVGADAQPVLGLTAEVEAEDDVDAVDAGAAAESDDDAHAGSDDDARAGDGASAHDDDDDPDAEPEALIVDLDAVDEDDLEDRPSRVSVVRSSVQPDGTEVVDEPTASSDSFLEELRRAVEAPTDLVESEEDRALSAFFEHEDEEPKRRFGRRR